MFHAVMLRVDVGTVLLWTHFILFSLYSIYVAKLISFMYTMYCGVLVTWGTSIGGCSVDFEWWFLKVFLNKTICSSIQ